MDISIGYIYTNSGYQVETLENMQAIDKEFECDICSTSYQSSLKCRNCTLLTCISCYVKAKKKMGYCGHCHMPYTGDVLTDLKLKPTDYQKQLSSELKVKCLEQSCQKTVSLEQMDSHIETTHQAGYPKIANKSESSEFGMHMKSVNLLTGKREAEEKEKEERQLLARVQSAEQYQQTAPVPEKIIKLARIPRLLNTAQRQHLIVHICQFFLSEPSILQDNIQLAYMLNCYVTDRERANRLFQYLPTSVFNNRFSFASVEEFCLEFFPELARPRSETRADSQIVYMDKSVNDVIRNADERQARIKLFNAILSFGKNEIMVLANALALNIPAQHNPDENDNTDALRSKIILEMCDKDLSLNTIFQKIEHFLPNTKVKTIDNNPDVYREISGNFDKTLTLNSKERLMVNKINRKLTQAQVTLISLLLVDAGAVYEQSDFMQLFSYLRDHDIKLKQLVLALVDTGLFDTVKKAITSCYGDN